MKEQISYGVAHYTDRIVVSANFCQRIADTYQRRRDAQLQACGGQLRRGDQLNAIAELFGKAQVDGVERIDTDSRYLIPTNAGTESQAR